MPRPLAVKTNINAPIRLRMRIKKPDGKAVPSEDVAKKVKAIPEGAPLSRPRHPQALRQRGCGEARETSPR